MQQLSMTAHSNTCYQQIHRVISGWGRCFVADQLW